jgi:hypothetical protein
MAAKGMARETGLEPATSGVTGRRSNQLSYSPACAPPRWPRRDLPDRIGAGPPSQARARSSAGNGQSPARAQARHTTGDRGLPPIRCKILDLIHRRLSDFAVHPMGRALSARRSPKGRPSQATGYGSRRESRCSASLTESIRSPNSPPSDECRVAISRDRD